MDSMQAAIYDVRLKEEAGLLKRKRSAPEVVEEANEEVVEEASDEVIVEEAIVE